MIVVLSPGLAEQPGNVILDSDEQLFCVLAALNVAGYDTGMEAADASSTRAEVRAFLERKHGAVVPQLRAFYTEHHVAGDSGADLGQYVSLALLLGSPPDFRFTVAESDLPPDAKAVRGLVPLLKTFYRQADLAGLWPRVQPRFQDEIEHYSSAVRKSVSLCDAYLRFPSGAYLGRTYTIYLSLLGAPEQVQARIYGENYYLVITPAKEPKITEIRHQYLHFLLDPLAVKYAAEVRQKSPLQSIARNAPALEKDFKEDFPLLLTECLIRAVELRMDKNTKPAKTVSDLTAGGLILVPYFYDALAGYQRQEASMNVYYKQMVLGINLQEEQQKLATAQFSARAPTAPAAPARASPPVSEQDRLLDDGDNLIYEGKYAEAKPVFQGVLEKQDAKSERALFGLAVVYSNLRKPDLAEGYFKKTLDVARDLRISTWCHIYLGRIYDIEGKREAALEQYRAASITAGGFPDAFAAVQNGLQHPFGSQN